MTAAQRLALPAAWLGLIVLVGVIEPDAFLTSANAQNILGSQAVLVVLTMGLLIALTAGDYDLSIASVLTLSSMIVALLNAQQGWPVGLAIVVAVVARALAGLTTGGVPRRHSILPGRFNPWGSIVAVYFVVTEVTGLQQLGATSFVPQLFYGGGPISAVAVSRLAGSGMPGAGET